MFFRLHHTYLGGLLTLCLCDWLFQVKFAGKILTRTCMLAPRWSARVRTPTHETSSTRWRATNSVWTEPCPTRDMTSMYQKLPIGALTQTQFFFVLMWQRRLCVCMLSIFYLSVWLIGIGLIRSLGNSLYCRLPDETGKCRADSQRPLSALFTTQTRGYACWLFCLLNGSGDKKELWHGSRLIPLLEELIF